jgi:hypothetical protein
MKKDSVPSSLMLYKQMKYITAQGKTEQNKIQTLFIISAFSPSQLWKKNV